MQNSPSTGGGGGRPKTVKNAVPKMGFKHPFRKFKFHQLMARRYKS